MTTRTQVAPARRLIAVLCALALALLLVPITAPVAGAAPISKTGTSGSCTWTLDTDGALVIAPTNGTSGTLGEFSYPGESTQAPWLEHRTSIRSVVIKSGVKAGSNVSGMFANCSYISSMDLSGLDTSGVTNMKDMFLGCKDVSSLDVSRFDTSRVTDMSSMFKGCASIASLNVSSFDTTNVTSMNGMFSQCSKLSSLDLSNFKTSKVEDMSYMFSENPVLSSLNISKLDTSRVSAMEGMFWYCSSLSSLDVSNFDTARVGIMNTMFMGCSSLSKLDLSSFDTSNVIVMAGMFSGCRSLSSLDLSSFDTSKVTMMKLGSQSMFANCKDLATVKLGDRFSFKGALAEPLSMLPDGAWKSAALDKTFTAVEIANDRNNIADTYTRDVYDSGSETPHPSEPMGDPIDMYRLYNPNSGEHFYTASAHERDEVAAAGWNYEGVGWTAPSEGQAVYRLYNSIAGDHHYTMSSHERDTLVGLGWTNEGIGWYSGGYTPLMREYNPNQYANNHNYTTSQNEHDTLVGLGWNDEGIAWYGIK